MGHGCPNIVNFKVAKFQQIQQTTYLRTLPETALVLQEEEEVVKNATTVRRYTEVINLRFPNSGIESAPAKLQV